MKTILLIDSDLGFAFWLGHALDQAGYEALPARNTSDAVKVLEELNLVVDLVLVNAALPGAEAFLADLRSAQGPFRVIAVYDQPLPSEPLVGADAILSKTPAVDENARMEWVQAVRKVLTSNAATNKPV